VGPLNERAALLIAEWRQEDEGSVGHYRAGRIWSAGRGGLA